MINVNLPDGSVAQFPDGTTPDVMKAAIQKKFPPDNPPAGATPGDLAYKNWAIARAKAGKSLPQVSPTPPSAGTPPQVTANQSPNLLNSTLATVNGMTGAVPGLQQASDGLLAMGQTVGDIFANRPGTVEQHYADIQKQRQQVAANAPVANVLGSLAPAMGVPALASAAPAVGEAMGLTGSVGKQLLNSTLFGAGLNGLQGLVQGKTGGNLLADEGLGAAGGALGSAVGQSLGGAGQTIADALTNRAQNALIDQGIAAGGSGLSSDAIKQGARDLFSSSVDNDPLQLTSDAYNNLLGNISKSLQNMRPNELNNGPVVGVLQKLWGLGQDAADPTSNAVIDLKDLHILRQAANEVAVMSGQNGLMGHTIVNNIDSFINGLKPQDIAGGGKFVPMAEGDPQFQWSWSRSPDTAMAAAKFGDNVYTGLTHAEALQNAIDAEGPGIKAAVNANPEAHLGYQLAPDPTQASADLLQGISDWAKARRVDIISDAVTKAQGAPSGFENGLKRTFSAIMRSDDWSRFSPAEKSAIEQVAKGTTGQNIASALGKLGINFNGSQGAANILGGGIGTAGVAKVLAPILGGPAATWAAPAITTPLGAIGRNVATDIASTNATRALQAVAAGNIAKATPIQNLLEGPAAAANLLTRSIVPILPQLAKPVLSGAVSTN